MKKEEFLSGIKDGIPICLGYFSVSIAFGMAAVLAGVPAWAAVLISLTNLTSAGQFAGINVITAGGSLIELTLTTLIINIRYFLMSLSISQRVDKKITIWERMACAFGITDEIFAVSMERKTSLTASYMLGIIITPVLGWTGGTLAGAVATSFMPEILSDAMGILLYGMFIAVIIPAAKEKKSVFITVILAIFASVVFTCLPFLKNLSAGWLIIIITILVSALSATLFPVKEDENEC